MDGVTVRRAVVGDARALLELWDEAYATARHADDEAFLERALTDDHVVCMVAEVSSRTVGSLLAAFDGWRGNLYRLAVMPEFRHRGIARELLVAAERGLTGLGAARITAIVDRDNAPAVAFWEAAGYRPNLGDVRYVRSR